MDFPPQLQSLHSYICFETIYLPSLIANELASSTTHPRYGDLLEKFGQFNAALGEFPSSTKGIPAKVVKEAAERLRDSAGSLSDIAREINPQSPLAIYLLRFHLQLNLLVLGLI